MSDTIRWLPQTQTWWLSFTDPARPAGTQFLGVAIVDVTEGDAAAALPFVQEIRDAYRLPPPAPDSAPVWIAAAMRKAHATGCNPGGQIAPLRLDGSPLFAAMDKRLPRHRLLSRAEMSERGIL